MKASYEFGRFTLDPDENRLTADGVQVAVTPKAFDILVALVRKAPRLVAKDQLLREVWPDSFVEEANLTVHISALRRMLGEGAGDRYIETVPRRGYRFVAPVRIVEIADAPPVAETTEPSALEGGGAAAPGLVGLSSATEAPVIAPEQKMSTGVAGISDPSPDVQSDARPRPDTATPPKRQTAWAWLAGAAAGAALLALVAVLTLSPSSARRGDLSWERTATQGRLTRLLTTVPDASDPALSPDGRMLAYIAADANGQPDLYIAQLTGGGQLRLTNDAALEQRPRFSPGGERLIFTRLLPTSSTAEISVVSILGGPSRLVTRGQSAAWSPRGDRIAYVGRPQPDSAQALFTSTLEGTDVREILGPSAAYQFLRNPAWSRDGRDVAIVRGTGGVAGEIWLVPAEGGSPRRFTQGGGEVWSDSPVFTPDGSGIIYMSNRGGATNLWIQMFDDNSSLRLTTGPGPEGSPTVSGEGAVVFISSRKRDELFVHSLGDGTTQSLMSHAPFVWAPVVSPDGKEIAFNRNEVDGSWHVWTMPADGRGAPRQLTSGPTGEIHARYTPDGQSIIYHSWGSPRRIWRVPRQGGPPVQLTFGDYEDGYADASPDGQWIAFARTDGAERIHVAPFGGGAARPLTERPSSVPRWSPDGRLIAFSPGRGFNGGIFVIAPDGSGERRLTDVGGWPVWWPDGKQIAYLAVGGEGAQQIWSVPATGGAPRRIGGVRFTGYNYPFDIARDGRHIAGSREVLISREIWLLQPPT